MAQGDYMDGALSYNNSWSGWGGGFSSKLSDSDHDEAPVRRLQEYPDYCFMNAATCPECGGGMARMGTCFACTVCGGGGCDN